jgi:hypothetical protein
MHFRKLFVVLSKVKLSGRSPLFHATNEGKNGERNCET